jgi:hypothetical protein
MTRVGWICSDLEVYGFIQKWYADFNDKKNLDGENAQVSWLRPYGILWSYGYSFFFSN